MSVGMILGREERPAYVQFERRPVEDRAETIKQGRYVAKDVDFVLITPSYSKDCIEREIPEWIASMKSNISQGRMTVDLYNKYIQSYEYWKNGQEIPLHGTPIKGWPVISPAQQEMLIHANIRTVEDLAGINAEGKARVGMGWLDLYNKAKAWLDSAKDHGQVVSKVASLESENISLKAELSALHEKVSILKSMVENDDRSESLVDDSTVTEIKRRGRPRKVEVQT